MASTNISSDKELLIASCLNTFMFQKVWNEVTGEFRHNVIPQVIAERSVSGSIRVYGIDIALPTTDTPYYLYAVSAAIMSGVVFPRQLNYDWTRLDDLVNNYDILLHVYHTSGLMIPKSGCYIYRLPNNVGFLIATSKKVSNKIIPYSEKNNIRLTIYYDSDVTDKISMRCFEIPHSDVNYAYRNEIYQYIRSCNQNGKDNTQVFIDGYESTIVNLSSFPLGSYVDIINDENIHFSFDIDLTDPEQNKGFYSDMDETYKQLVHIPKDLNPDNKVLTHNTMDIFVRRKDPEGDKTFKGLYLHRCANRSVTQVTHNDIAIPLYIVDAHRDNLKTQNITLHVVVREHSKDNVLIRDKNYIDLLYTHNDSEIIEFLCNRSEYKKLDFWTAEHLEKSVYVESMFDIPNIITPKNMTYYIDGLGYYHTMSLLTEKIVSAKITEWFESGYVFPKPYVYQGSPVYPLVYLDGKKVDDDYISLVDLTNNSYVGVGFKKGYTVKTGSTMSIEMFIDGIKTVYDFTPEVNNTFIVVPYNEFDILEEIDNSTIPISGFDRKVNKSYKLFKDYPGNISIQTTKDNQYRIVFGTTLYGKRFIIQPKNRVYRRKVNLKDLIKNGDPLFIDLNVNVRNTIEEVPLWNTPNVIVYLNGKYLTEGVDFTIQEIKDYDGNLAIKVIAIQNVSWLENKNNVVEYYITSAHDENKKFGWLVDNTAYIENKELAIYFPKMTSCHIDGESELNLVDYGNRFKVLDNKYRQGALFELRTSVPEFISEYLSRYHVNDDIERMEILNEYFYGRAENLPERIILEESHICYSTYTASVIRDIVNGNLKGLSYDPDEERMRDQVSGYKYLAESDLVHEEKYDLRFVDTLPHYRQFSVETPEQRHVLQAFIRLTMPKDDNISNKTDVSIIVP